MKKQNVHRKLCLLLKQLEVPEILALRDRFEIELEKDLKNGGAKASIYFSLIDLLSAWRQIREKQDGT